MDTIILAATLCIVLPGNKEKREQMIQCLKRQHFGSTFSFGKNGKQHVMYINQGTCDCCSCCLTTETKVIKKKCYVYNEHDRYYCQHINFKLPESFYLTIGKHILTPTFSRLNIKDLPFDVLPKVLIEDIKDLVGFKLLQDRTNPELENGNQFCKSCVINFFNRKYLEIAQDFSDPYVDYTMTFNLLTKSAYQHVYPKGFSHRLKRSFNSVETLESYRQRVIEKIRSCVADQI